jgi:hypothetical protein
MLVSVARFVTTRRMDGHGEAICEDRAGAQGLHRAAEDLLRRQRSAEGTCQRFPQGAVVNPANDVAYLDCTGSGSETRAHLMASDDKRLTIMFCAFEGDPVILRLYGQGQSLMRGTPEYAALIPQFEEVPGARQIVRLDVDLVQTSCGLGVPLFDYNQERGSLVRYWTAQGITNLRKYWGLKNMKSIDGLPTGLPRTV